MTTTTTVGFSVVETTTVTDDQGQIVSQSSEYRVVTPQEVTAILAAAQKGQPTIAATAASASVA